MAKKKRAVKAKTSKDKPSSRKQSTRSATKPSSRGAESTTTGGSSRGMALSNALIVKVDFFDAENSELTVRLTRGNGSFNEQKITVSGKLGFDNASKNDIITVSGVCPGSGELRTNRKTDPQSSEANPRKYKDGVIDLLTIES